MTDTPEWQCSECHTPVDRETTRKCPSCGNVVFYPVADDVVGDERGELRLTDLDLETAMERLEEAKRRGSESSTGGR